MLSLCWSFVVMAVGAVAVTPRELIMLEIQPVYYPKTIVKRSPQYSQDQQYVQQATATAADGVPQEYYNFLQSLQLHQRAQQQQPDPNNLQQVLVSRTPQTFVGQPQRPPPRRLTPEQEQQRRLQENIVQKNIREQEIRDAQRAQQAQLQKIYQQDPVYLAQLQQQAQPQYVQVPVQPQPAQQYIQLPAQPQQYVAPSVQQADSERVSYSQVQFGSSKLPRKLAKILPQNVQPSSNLYGQPIAQAQPLTYTSSQQPAYRAPQLVYTGPSPQQELVYTQAQPQANIYQTEIRKPSSEKEGLPQQYLIETTKVEQQPQVVTIPKPKTQQIYYRPQPSYQDLQASIIAQQQAAHYAQQQLEASTTPSPPSRSSIFVTTANTPELKPTYHKLPEVRLPKQSHQRPLSQNELNALINAGFKVTPSPSSAASLPVAAQRPEYTATYQPQFTYYKDLSKRQNKPVPRPVHLTAEERQALAKQGIRNLYRVETAESNDSPVTYVLALSTPTNNKS